MLAPRKQKYRKQFRGGFRRIATKGNKVDFGSFGIKALEAGWIRDREIEACRVILARATRKVGKFWIRIFPDKSYTKKPPEVGMGAGKGDVAYFVAVVEPGKVLFEIDGLPEKEAISTLKKVSSKLSVKSKIVKREE